MRHIAYLLTFLLMSSAIAESTACSSKPGGTAETPDDARGRADYDPEPLPIETSPVQAQCDGWHRRCRSVAISEQSAVNAGRCFQRRGYFCDLASGKKYWFGPADVDVFAPPQPVRDSSQEEVDRFCAESHARCQRQGEMRRKTILEATCDQTTLIFTCQADDRMWRWGGR